MKATKSLLVAAFAVAGLAMAADAQANPAARSGGWSGGSHGGGNWGGHHGSWGGHHGSWGDHHGSWGGHHGSWGGHRYWGPQAGFYFGAPLLFGSLAWGYPYDYYYPRTVVVDRVIERYPESYPEGVIESAPTTEVPPGEGAPSQGPTYMNYCASASAYYPKVTTCPEGWKFVPSR